MAVREDEAPELIRFRGVEYRLRLETGPADSQPMGPPYHRSVVAAESASGATVNHRTLSFSGARSGFMCNATDGLVTIIRTPEDVVADGFTGMGLTLVIGGRLRVLSGGRDETFEAGDLFLEHTGSPRTGVSGLNPGTLIYIPKARFVEAITVPFDQINLMRLNRAALAPAVIQQIEFLTANFDLISPEEFEAVLEAVVDLSLVMLRKEIARALPVVDPVLAAAKAYIATHYRDTSLTPAALARSLGCSRAVLYRAFAHGDLTVLRYVRDVRFHHFLQALRVQPEVSISQLAYDSGFSASPSDFTKLFKRTYGVTPSQLQAQLRPRS
jgi:AraC-like DNA-binding protein